MKKFGLGKGLEALIPHTDIEKEELVEVNLDKIEPNPHQPREKFKRDSLEELASSIKEQGVIQPILVRAKGDGYQIIAGERRLRAAKIAGLKSIPALVRSPSDSKLLELSLVENLQRENLNPLERAKAYRRLKEVGLTQEELASRLGKSRSEVANTLRLLKLPPFIQEGIHQGRINEGQARAMLGVESLRLQREVFKKVEKEGLSVRQTEKLVKKLSHLPKKAGKKKKWGELYLRQAEEQLQNVLGTKVTIKAKGKEGGIITIEYYSSEDLQRVMEVIGEGK
ncbi:MAG: hypothetical protein COS84_02700 [Armatimonadetes bacterium CG07_land_8_20_14_0_80_40_9]|nr:MAG: hypothetical protein COS84_02700 [Armatimonadetes bacterium CG07_land_8_20_14_0_80_40_9]